jgi:D-aspartate ligase
MSSSPPAVILSGGPIAISVARSLGSAGVRVYALGEAPWETVGHSRYCHSFIDLGGGVGIADRWLTWLESGPRGAVLLPCHDEGLVLVARNRSLLVRMGYTPIEANDEVMLAMLDKEQTYVLARRAGIATPRTAVLRGRDDLNPAASKIGFPCAVKPLHSHLFARHFGLKRKVIIVRDRSELAQAFEEIAPLGLSTMVTEIIQGGDDQLWSFLAYMDEHGEPLLRFVKRKLRQYPPEFGLGCYHVTEWDEEVAELGLHFFRSIGLRGVAYVEFKRDERDGSLKLIECNHRFGAGIELLRAAGIDLPLLTYERLVGRRVKRVDVYREGVRLWHPVDDARAFLAYRRRGSLSFSGWLRSLIHALHVPVFRWDDPKPSLVELWLMLTLLPQKVPHEASHDQEQASRQR